eukprot:SAG31_NODE_3271_length_4477_cov_2.348561_3_plen_553_part_00
MHVPSAVTHYWYAGSNCAPQNLLRKVVLRASETSAGRCVQDSSRQVEYMASCKLANGGDEGESACPKPAGTVNGLIIRRFPQLNAPTVVGWVDPPAQSPEQEPEPEPEPSGLELESELGPDSQLDGSWVISETDNLTDVAAEAATPAPPPMGTPIYGPTGPVCLGDPIGHLLLLDQASIYRPDMETVVAADAAVSVATTLSVDMASAGAEDAFDAVEQEFSRAIGGPNGCINGTSPMISSGEGGELLSILLPQASASSRAETRVYKSVKVCCGPATALFYAFADGRCQTIAAEASREFALGEACGFDTVGQHQYVAMCAGGAVTARCPPLPAHRPNFAELRDAASTETSETGLALKAWMIIPAAGLALLLLCGGSFFLLPKDLTSRLRRCRFKRKYGEYESLHQLGLRRVHGATKARKKDTVDINDATITAELDGSKATWKRATEQCIAVLTAAQEAVDWIWDTKMNEAEAEIYTLWKIALREATLPLDYAAANSCEEDPGIKKAADGARRLEVNFVFIDLDCIREHLFIAWIVMFGAPAVDCGARIGECTS